MAPLRQGEGDEPTAILCVSRDVTAEHEAAAALQASEERLATALHVGDMGVWDYDIQRDHLCCDEQWYRMVGADPARQVQSIDDFRPFIHPADRDRATEVVESAAQLIESGSDYAIVFRIVRRDGEVRWVRSAAHVQQEDGTPMRAVGFIVDITDAWRGELALRHANRNLEKERRSLARQALEDPLTGVANRRHLDRELARMCVEAKTNGQPLVVGMIDVDLFKRYNDRYGHLAGDEALQRTAQAVKLVAGPNAVVTRYGGEEFVVAIPGVVDPVPMLDRFLAAVDDLAITHDDSATGRLTISCGCVVATDEADLEPWSLLGQCDEALYEAKVAGRDRYVLRVLRRGSGHH